MMTLGAGLNESQRSATLAALQEFYCPVQVDDVNAYAAVFAPEVGGLSDLAKVLADEASAWRSGRLGPNWMCPALVDAEAAANPTYLTRSDWSLENRLIIQGGSQVRHLWLVRVFSDHYLVAEEQGLRNLVSFVSRIRYHAESAAFNLPAWVISSLDHGANEIGEDAIEELREAAENSHAALAAKEQPARRQLAQHLEQLDSHRRLFGNILSDYRD